MGDISAEPSMEEILSSIKRIIAEEEAPTGRKRATARQPVPAAAAAPALPVVQTASAVEEDEVLELSDPMPPTAPEPRSELQSEPGPASIEALRPETVSVPDSPKPADPILSPAAADATRGALESLSRLMVKPEPQSDGTLEGLVRDMLRPMLREWLDAHLPDMVEAMVSREIARISGQPR